MNNCRKNFIGPSQTLQGFLSNIDSFMQDYGPPAEVVEAGIFQHPCEGEAVCKLTNEKVSVLVRCTAKRIAMSDNIE